MRFAVVLACAVLLASLPLRSGEAENELRIAVQQEPATLNPVIATLAVEADAYNLLFDGLFRDDEHGNLVPDLATRVPTQQNGDISRDGRTITYHLVRTARWSDGQPVTSDDVKFTFEAIMNDRNTVVNRYPYNTFARVDAPDRSTVVVHLKQPLSLVVPAAFLDSIQGAIVPAHLLRTSADLNRDSFNTAPVGSGPYTLVAWHRGSDMVFAANPAYFRGAPKIGRIVWDFTPDENAILAQLRTHEVDLVDKLGIAPYVQVAHAPGLTATMGPSLGWEHLSFNTAKGPLRDVRVRRALCDGINLNDVYTKVLHGVGDLGAGLEHPRSTWYDHSVAPCRFDPAAARALLDAAGWRTGPNGMRSKDGVPLQISFGTVAGIIDRQQTQVLLQSEWHDLGVDTILRTFPPATFFAPAQSGGILMSGNFDVGLSAYFITSVDPSRIEYDTTANIAPHGLNTSFWSSPKVDALEEEGARTFDVAARKRIYDQMQRLVAAAVPYVTMRWWTQIVMHDDRIHGIRPPLAGSTYWNIQDWTN